MTLASIAGNILEQLARKIYMRRTTHLRTRHLVPRANPPQMATYFIPPVFPLHLVKMKRDPYRPRPDAFSGVAQRT
jgi:hypothetical protein